MRVLVLGGSGFLGCRLVPKLVQRPHDVFAIARSDAAAAVLAELGADPIAGDLSWPDPARITEAMRTSSAEALLMCVPLSDGHGPLVVRCAEDAGIGRAVFVSTTSIFTSVSSEAKPARLGAEAAITSSSLDWTIIRPTMIYGRPDDRNMARLVRLAGRAPIIPLPGGGRGLQQPVHVDDVASVIVESLDHPVASKMTYEVAGPEAMTFRAVIEEIGRALGKKLSTFALPLTPIVAAATAYERIARRPRFRAEQFERLGEDKAFDISGARRDLGFAPRSFADGIRAEVELMREAGLLSR